MKSDEPRNDRAYTGACTSACTRACTSAHTRAFTNSCSGSNRSDGSCSDVDRHTGTASHDDAEMEDIFSALDDVCASSEVKSRTLDAIASQAEGLDEPSIANTDRATADQPKRQSHLERPSEQEDPRAARGTIVDVEPLLNGATKQSGRGTAAPRKRNRWRAIRVAAVAACLSLACFGGIAYATPAAHVTVQTEQGAVKMDVNRFGVTIGASADSAATEATLGGANVGNRSYEDSLDSLLDAMGDSDDQTVSISVEAQDDEMRGRMEKRGAEALERHKQKREEQGSVDNSSSAAQPDSLSAQDAQTQPVTQPGEQAPEQSNALSPNGDQHPEPDAQNQPAANPEQPLNEEPAPVDPHSGEAQPSGEPQTPEAAEVPGNGVSKPAAPSQAAPESQLPPDAQNSGSSGVFPPEAQPPMQG